jgi:hypothetical protein
MINISDIIQKDKNNNFKKSKITDKSPATNQGKKFKKYQSKFSDSLEKNAEILSGKEGFTELGENGLTAQNNKIISNNDYSSKQPIIDNLREEYQTTLQQYENLLTQISGDTKEYINRVNPNNPYLNKVVQFTTGHVCYVTNQGVVKWIPSMDVWKSLNISQTVQTPLSIPWLDTYYTPGTQIATTPLLLSGTNVQMGQSFGSEGANVFVNQLLPQNIKPSYMGCYATSPNNDNMTFIGGAPPPTDVSITNGNFSQPIIANNTFQYINSTSQVPGWVFRGPALLNNSSAWGYPMPYPNGNQCVSLQNTTYIYALVNLSAGVNYTLTFYACGRNCCMNPNEGNEISIQLYINEKDFIKEIFHTTPPINQWTQYTANFTVPTTQVYNLTFSGVNNSGDRSSAIQNISLSSVSASSGSYTYNDCMQAAIQQGYQYFALQNVNTNTSTGYCAVSNSSPAVSQYGVSTAPNKVVTLWSSNTAGQPGNTAILSNTGSLQVLNSSGQAVYSSPGSNANPANYLGCYGDNPNRAMTSMLTGGLQQYDNSQCQQSAQQQGFQYYGLQNSTSGTNAQCFLSNDISQTMQYGLATNCTQINDGSWSGGGWSNAVYNTTLPQSNYFLILQDNGNMVIYRGTDPNDNQGTIWSTQTNGQQQEANPAMVSSKGKYGRNWMSSSGTLAPGDFIGSSDGKIALVMQSDGNLVLYTYQMGSNCQKMNDGNMGGGVLGNAAYDISKTAIPENIGQVAFIDGNSSLHTYPSSNQTYANTYSTSYQNTDTYGNDLSGAAFANATLETCQTACNNNANCAGFVLDVGGSYSNTCFPKTNQMYPYGGPISTINGVNLYIRDKIPSSPPIGVPQTTLSTDTVTYQNYINGGEIGSKYGLANLNSTQKQQLDQLQTKLNMLSNQINGLNNSFKTGSSIANYQADNNISGINDYIKDIKRTNIKSKKVAHESAGGIQNILKDSDIVVLQKNYDYLFWSILAAGAVLVSINVVKK